jgi:hypothetical protein
MIDFITSRSAFPRRLPARGMRAPVVMAASPNLGRLACKGNDG